MNGKDNEKEEKSENDGSAPTKERGTRVDDGGNNTGGSQGEGEGGASEGGASEGGGGGRATVVEAQLRATEKQVVSGKKQVVSPRQQRPSSSSSAPTTHTPVATSAATSATAAPNSSISTSRSTITSSSSNNNNIEANLRQTEQEILSSGGTNKKKLVSSSMSSRSKTEPTDTIGSESSIPDTAKPTTSLSVTDAVQANLRQTEQQLMSGRKVAKPQNENPNTTTPTPTAAAATVEATLRQTEQQVLSGKKQAPRTQNAEQQLRQVQASVMKKENTEKEGTNLLEQVATDMRATRNAPQEPPASPSQPLQKLDRSLLSDNRTRQQQQQLQGDQKTTIPNAVGPDGHALSNRELQHMVGDQYQPGNNTVSRPTPSASTSASAAVAMGTVVPPTFDSQNATPAPTSMAAALQQEQFASDEEAYQRTLQASMGEATRPTATTAPTPPEPETTPAASAEIQAFVAENAPVTAVAIEAEEAQERAKFRKMIYIVGACLVIIVVVVVVAVVVASGGGDDDGDDEPTLSPTPSPTMAPTTAGEAALVDCLASSPVADVLDVNQLRTNKTSPQFRAVSWMANEDEMYQGCTSGVTSIDSKLWERYALVTFYFAVNGPRWGICGQKDPSCSAGTYLGIADDCLSNCRTLTFCMQTVLLCSVWYRR